MHEASAKTSGLDANAQVGDFQPNVTPTLNFVEAESHLIHTTSTMTRTVPRAMDVEALVEEASRHLSPHKLKFQFYLAHSMSQMTTSIGTVRHFAEDGLKRKCLPDLPLHPDSKIRTSLDLCCLLFMVYDFITVPYAFSFGVTNYILKYGNWVTVTFWSLDLVAGFLEPVYLGEIVACQCDCLSHQRKCCGGF
jgi:hypothetical protein